MIKESEEDEYAEDEDGEAPLIEKKEDEDDKD
jgi:hypothetical protein